MGKNYSQGAETPEKDLERPHSTNSGMDRRRSRVGEVRRPSDLREWRRSGFVRRDKRRHRYEGLRSTRTHYQE